MINNDFAKKHRADLQNVRTHELGKLEKNEKEEIWKNVRKKKKIFFNSIEFYSIYFFSQIASIIYSIISN